MIFRVLQFNMATPPKTGETPSMVVNIRLAKRFEMDAGDSMGRTWAGWDPLATDAELWENNRGRHRFGARVEHEEFATLSFEGTIRVVARISGREEMPSQRPPKELGADRRGPPCRRPSSRFAGGAAGNARS